MTQQEHERLLQLRHEADIQGLIMMYGDGTKIPRAETPPPRGESIDRQEDES